jgi:hypothetical protein
MRENGMKKIVIAIAALTASAGIGYAAGSGDIPDISTLNPQAMKVLVPADIKWRPAAGLEGTDTYTLFGDPGKPGFYIVLNHFHPGYFSHPHYHANDRYVMVLSGTWWAATGAKDDPEHMTEPIKAGSFAIHKGREVHYDGARAGTGEELVMIFGEGPGSRHECYGPTAEKGPGPCTDARKAAGIN